MKRLSRLFRKLEHFEPLTIDERAAIEAAAVAVRQFQPRQDLIQEGESPDGIKVILQGMACRYKMLVDGRRQIVSYFVPGDFCDLRAYLLRRMDHSVAALGPMEAAVLPQESINGITATYPRITRALWWSTLVDEAIAREWIVNVGVRTAFERMAHLFCELYVRLKVVGLTTENSFELPLTQIELAETLALSAVHVNRTLMDMRRMQLVSFQGRQLTIHNQEELRRLAGFDPNYLHLDSQLQPRAPAGVRTA